MRYATAVRRLRQIAADAHRVNLPNEDPLLLAVYTFGPLLQHPAEIEAVDIALVCDAPADELSWRAEPPWTLRIVETLRLKEAPVRWYFRPATWPVSNHIIREPLRVWSLEEADEQALTGLVDGRAQPLRLPAPSRTVQRAQQAAELAAARRRLRQVHDSYWDRDWRHAHSRPGVYPETHLFNAVSGYLDLLDAGEEHAP
jgi:hypothetical protein